MSRRPKPERQKVIALMLAGKTNREIQIRYPNISKACFSVWRKRSGMPKLKREFDEQAHRLKYKHIFNLYAKVKSFAEVARRFDMWPQHVEQILKPHKHHARVATYNAIKSGKIKKRKTCARCKRKRASEVHHLDYSQPLKVLWVCKKCHTQLHANDQRVYHIRAYNPKYGF